ncbi:MAG: hypothetical protein QM778_33260 [Myxococcales bacterium]
MLVAAGSTVPVAAAAAGIPKKTIEAWMHKGREGLDPYSELVEGIREAKAVHEASLLQRLNKAGAKDWRADAWMLERRYGKRWRPPSQRQELTGANGGPVQLENLPTAELIACLRDTEEQPRA